MKTNCGSVRRARALLGTLVEIRVSASAEAERAIGHAFAAIERVHHAMSAQESTSDIARLRAGRRFSLDPWTRRVLDRAEEICLASAGLFDCAACDYALDGIAKGFAVDRAVECLQHAGINAGVVNAGGDLRVFGDAFEDIHVPTPHEPARVLYIGRVRNTAIATSASAGLVDPLARARRLRAAGATVIASDCMSADALTKPCMLEPVKAEKLASQFGAKAIVL